MSEEGIFSSGTRHLHATSERFYCHPERIEFDYNEGINYAEGSQTKNQLILNLRSLMINIGSPKNDLSRSEL